MPALADDGPDMVIQCLGKARIARSVRSVLPLPVTKTETISTAVARVGVEAVLRTLGAAKDEQQRLLAELLKAVARGQEQTVSACAKGSM